jgi:hypothetical protein
MTFSRQQVWQKVAERVLFVYNKDAQFHMLVSLLHPVCHKGPGKARQVLFPGPAP